MSLCLTPWASPPLALTLGGAFALAFGQPFGKTAHGVSRLLLQTCVVFLGFGMNLVVVLQAGASGAMFGAATIIATVVLGYFLNKLWPIESKASILISAGTAICGGSAIAAVGSAIEASESDMTIAMGVVFLLNGAALYLFPSIGHVLHLSEQQFGTWAGVAIHDVSSVVGAASRFGLTALQIATAVKLSRALWIAPLTFAIAFTHRKDALEIEPAAGGNQSSKPISVRMPVPWFIGLFLVASLCRSFVPAVSMFAPALSQMATAGLTITLFLVGSGLTVATLKRVGWRAMFQGLALWAFISIASLLVVLFWIH